MDYFMAFLLGILGFFTLFLLKKQGESAKIKKEIEEIHDKNRKHREEINQNQPGDPLKAADVMIEVSERAERPVHLFLGSDAYGLAQNKLEELKTDIERMKSLTISTDY